MNIQSNSRTMMVTTLHATSLKNKAIRNAHHSPQQMSSVNRCNVPRQVTTDTCQVPSRMKYVYRTILNYTAPCGLRRKSAAAWLRVWIPLSTRTFVSCLLCGVKVAAFATSWSLAQRGPKARACGCGCAPLRVSDQKPKKWGGLGPT